tara:strand:+ start:1163 stop:1903 length:741 start_codon:yes stop_codon:yes gene_type:complete
LDFSGKTVLVTGGTRGIGFSILDAFLTVGAKVIVTGTNIKKPENLNTFERYNDKLVYIRLDFSSQDSIGKFLNKIKKYKQIDVLVNNAGVNKINPISDTEESDWDFINSVNLKGPFLITKIVSKIMLKNRSGKILNIASIFGVVSKRKRSIYSATKSGLIGFTKSVALDLAEHNILVNALSPGFVDTELTRKILNNSQIDELKSLIPQKRLADAHEIANVVLFLCSEKNSYITGQNIIVDGGFVSA